MHIYSQEEYIYMVLITLSKEKDETWNNKKEFGIFLIFVYTVKKKGRASSQGTFFFKIKWDEK